MKFFENIYPFEVCLEVICKEKLNSFFRSPFLDLFTQSYLMNDCNFCLIKSFPNNLKFSNPEFIIDVEIPQMNLINKRYFSEREDMKLEPRVINLKGFSINFL